MYKGISFRIRVYFHDMSLKTDSFHQIDLSESAHSTSRREPEYLLTLTPQL